MFINLTPHSISIHGANGIVTFPPSGQLARCSVSRKPVRVVDGIQLSTVVYGEVTGLPAPAEGVWYIVSGMVRDAVKGRQDVVSPGELIRDERGNPAGTKGLDMNVNVTEAVDESVILRLESRLEVQVLKDALMARSSGETWDGGYPWPSYAKFMFEKVDAQYPGEVR